jgi:uncharacterized protein YdbL (DUF1318 family)
MLKSPTAESWLVAVCGRAERVAEIDTELQAARRARTDAIRKAFKNGASREAIANAAGISVTRVIQMLRATDLPS